MYSDNPIRETTKDFESHDLSEEEDILEDKGLLSESGAQTPNSNLLTE